MQRHNKGLTILEKISVGVGALVIGVMLLAQSAQARRTNIQGGDDAIACFTDQALLPSVPVTSTVKVPVGMTEGLAALILVKGMAGGGTVTVDRLERIRGNETVLGYAIDSDTGGQRVINANGAKVYSESFTEGIESIQYRVTASTTATISILTATQ